MCDNSKLSGTSNFREHDFSYTAEGNSRHSSFGKVNIQRDGRLSANEAVSNLDLLSHSALSSHVVSFLIYDFYFQASGA